MHSRFVFTILLAILAFCLVTVCSPGLWRSKAQISAAGTMLRNRTPETEAAYREAKGRDRFRQYTVCAVAVLDTLVIIVYGAWLQQRTTSRPAAFNESTSRDLPG